MGDKPDLEPNYSTLAQPHSIDVESVLGQLDTSLDGLTEDEASHRFQKYGSNELVKGKKHPLWLSFLKQFKNYLTIILLVATAFSVLIGEITDALIILAIVLAAASLSFFEEYRSDKSIEALQRMTAPMTTVRREGLEKVIRTADVVPGDILVLHTGDKVAADARVIESFNLRSDESPLTGESVPVSKSIEPLPEGLELADRTNMVHMGTVVVYGRGTVAVTATGMGTEFGKIAGSLEEEETKTPLEERLDKTGKTLGQLCLVAAAIVAGLGLVRREPLLDVALFAIALAVAAIPEALPAVVTGALAIGTRRMAKRNALIRKLPAVETLGSASVICSDKTGTMTRGEMAVRKAYIPRMTLEVSGIGYAPTGDYTLNGNRIDPQGHRSLIQASKVAALCNDAKIEQSGDRWKTIGDPTEGALLAAAFKAGITGEYVQTHPRYSEIPFTSERKMMTTMHLEENRLLICTKGATEVLLPRCSRIHEAGQICPMRQKDREDIQNVAESFAGEALRVLAVAYKEEASTFNLSDEEKVENELVFAGLFAMIDPPREEAREAIRKCERAQIRVIMITGDNLLTAKAVAGELGMLKENSLVLAGAEIEKMTDKQLETVVERLAVCARVSPEHKLRIVRALKKCGHVVAMTGDGVNDAPAIKAADIGVAMGITGTDVTKEAAAMVLADDNFATIVAAVEEGRGIYDNIQKYLTYLLRCNIGEILIPLTASIMNISLPLTAIHYLWINLATDGLPALALGVDPPEPDLMERPPRDPKQSIFTREVKANLAYTPVLVTIAVLYFFAVTLPQGLVEARTTAFTMLVAIELFLAWGSRSLKRTILEVGPFRNKWLLASIAISLLMQLTVVSVPMLYKSFDVTTLTLQDWSVIIFASVSIFIITQGAIWLRRVVSNSKEGRSDQPL